MAPEKAACHFFIISGQHSAVSDQKRSNLAISNQPSALTVSPQLSPLTTHYSPFIIQPSLITHHSPISPRIAGSAETG